ncbi:hypothetical protein K503DRAFT_87072 [Rhizopogon vinicolor AM-OR11-026]|uniref:Uncharacterized protein n=1 Tax=Rhizopogon vinicolor AM-OR11-026 TaxID=1314800 RepID=A0A1B7MFP2_9AGAM|nr:hypothetical protein K503DRAFT_87072 [Rhizopogon vinicolor AM-OR11-026]
MIPSVVLRASWTWTQQLSIISATVPAPMPVPPTNAGAPAPSPVHCAFSELRTDLRHTGASLSSDVDKVCTLEKMITEYDEIQTEVVALRNFIHALSLNFSSRSLPSQRRLIFLSIFPQSSPHHFCIYKW